MGRAGSSFSIDRRGEKKPNLIASMIEVQKHLRKVEHGLEDLREENKWLREKLEKQ